MAPASTLSYSTVSMALRPPRAVVVFDGGDHWTYWARRALHLSGQVWGGCGFAIVPHRNGQVDPVLLRACRAYDPDFVVMFPRTVDELEQLRPGWFQIKGSDGQLLTGQEREKMLAMAKAQEVPPGQADVAARNVVADVCSPYRHRLDEDKWHEDVIILRGAGDRHFHDALAVPGALQGPVLACPSDWGGILSVAVASHAGIVEAPDHAAGEPGLTDQVARRLTSWLLDVRGAAAPDELVWPPAGIGIGTWTTPAAHQRAMTGLVSVSSGMPYSRIGLAVIGDAPEDFALARLWKLTFGVGVWLPSMLGIDQNEPPSAVADGLAEMARGLADQMGTLALTSISRSSEQLAQAYDGLSNAVRTAAIGIDEQVERLSILPSAELPWKQPLSIHLALEEQFDSYVTVPTVVDETGTRSMSAPLPAPILNEPDLAAHPNLTWHVDVSWLPSQAVRGRGLDGQEVFTPDTEQLLTWGRSSRHGISYQSHRYNFVLAGIPAVNKLARPGVRDLSLAAWVDAKGREHQFVARPSDAGHRTALLSRMLGGRPQFVDLFGGPFLPPFSLCFPTAGQAATPTRSRTAWSSPLVRAC